MSEPRPDRDLAHLAPDFAARVRAFLAASASARIAIPLGVVETFRSQDRQDWIVANHPDATRTDDSLHTLGRAVDLWPIDPATSEFMSFDPEDARVKPLLVRARKVAVAFGLVNPFAWDLGHFQDLSPAFASVAASASKTARGRSALAKVVTGAVLIGALYVAVTETGEDGKRRVKQSVRDHAGRVVLGHVLKSRAS